MQDAGGGRCACGGCVQKVRRACALRVSMCPYTCRGLSVSVLDRMVSTVCAHAAASVLLQPQSHVARPGSAAGKTLLSTPGHNKQPGLVVPQTEGCVSRPVPLQCTHCAQRPSCALCPTQTRIRTRTRTHTYALTHTHTHPQPHIKAHSHMHTEKTHRQKHTRARTRRSPQR